MTTNFTRDSVVHATAGQSIMGPHVCIWIAGKNEVSMSPTKAAEFGAFLVAKAAEALAGCADRMTEADDGNDQETKP